MRTYAPQLRGKQAKGSENYTPELVQRVWRGLHSDLRHTSSGSSLRPARAVGIPAVVRSHGPIENRQHDWKPDRPLWCALITRVVAPKSAEAKSSGALAALEKERIGLMSRNTFDMSTVREYGDLMRGPTIPEVMVGRVFNILGVKNSELEEEARIWKARSVFQGNQISTKSGVSAAELFTEVANAPASFVAARCGIATAALKRLSITFRDALQAYLQSSISGEGRTPTWAELPRA